MFLLVPKRSVLYSTSHEKATYVQFRLLFDFSHIQSLKVNIGFQVIFLNNAPNRFVVVFVIEP